MVEIDRWADALAAMRTVRIDAGRCLPLRSHRCSCSACSDICPEGAIQPGRLTQVAECSTCGLCASACPADAIGLDSPSDQELLQRFAREARRSTHLTLLCREDAAEGLSVGCLGRLTPELLLAAAACGLTTIDLLYDPVRCLPCRYSAGLPLLEAACQRARATLEQLEHPCQIRVTATRQALPPSAHPAPDRERPVHEERRRFLLAAFGLLREALPLAPHRPVGEESLRHLSRRREILLWALPRLAQERAEPPPWGAAGIALGALCHHCGICERLCPNSALSQSQGRLALDPQRCHTCGLCIQVCPVGALQLGLAHPLAEPLLLGEPLTYRCTGCGQEQQGEGPSSSPPPEPRCLPCALRPITAPRTEEVYLS